MWNSSITQNSTHENDNYGRMSYEYLSLKKKEYFPKICWNWLAMNENIQHSITIMKNLLTYMTI